MKRNLKDFVYVDDDLHGLLYLDTVNISSANACAVVNSRLHACLINNAIEHYVPWGSTFVYVGQAIYTAIVDWYRHPFADLSLCEYLIKLFG